MKNDKARFPFSMYAVSGEGRIVQAHTNKDAMEICQVLSGNVKIQVGTEVLDAAAGDFVFIPPTLVSLIDSESKASVRGMVFDSSIIEANMENFDAEVFYMFYLQSRRRIAPFRAGHPVYDVLSLYMQDSYEEYIGKDVCYMLPIRANIYLMMTALLRYYCGSKDDSDKLIYHNVLRMRPAIEYISLHSCEKIYIDKLAEMITVSPDYFTKMFKDSIGTTPIEYINGLRINEAMRLLSETEMTMTEIAETVGFCNSNYFHKIFKQYMDVSPLAYRKAAR